MMLKIAYGSIREDGTESRTGVQTYPSLEAFCAALNKGSAPSTGKQKWGPYWSPFDAPRKKGAKPDWTCLVLDFDNGITTETWELLSRYERVVYDTPSSTDAQTRYRVIVSLTEPAPFEVIGGLRRLFPDSDHAAVKPTQIFWHRHPEHEAKFYPGEKLDWGTVHVPPGPVPEQPAQTEPTMSKAALTAALYALDPSMGYDDWIKAGQALHHEHGGSDEGFQEWLHWSERSEKFAGVNDLHSHWRSFKAGGGITGLSLLAMQTAKVDDFPVIEQAQKRIRVIPARDFVHRERPPWLVKGLFGGELGVIYGESTAGKTFLAVDIAMHVARGVEWRGHRVRPGRVVWIAAEDAYGVQQRQLAYCKVNDCKPGIDAIDARVLLTKAEDVRDIIEAVGRAELLVVDTLARVNGGDENDAGEMSVLVRNCQALNKATGAFVLLIHHSGWDKQHLRGSSALRAAVDAELRVTLTESGDREAQATKVKGGASGRSYGFQLEVVELGRDADGDTETSCVVVPVESTERPSSVRLGGNQKIAWNVLQEMSGERIDAVVDAICERGGLRNSHAHRALRDLVGKKLVRFADSRVYLATDVAADFETLLGVSNGPSD